MNSKKGTPVYDLSGRPLYLTVALLLLLPLSLNSNRTLVARRVILWHPRILIYSSSAPYPVRGVSGLVASNPGATNGSVATLLLAASCQTSRPQTDQPSTLLRNKTQHPRVCLCGVNMFVSVRKLTHFQLRRYLTFGIFYQPCYAACYNNNVSHFLSLMPIF